MSELLSTSSALTVVHLVFVYFWTADDYTTSLARSRLSFHYLFDESPTLIRFTAMFAELYLSVHPVRKQDRDSRCLPAATLITIHVVS